MSGLNEDILLSIFEELQEDSKSLFSCLMVNRLWCETVVPILWRNPWCYSNINYANKTYLFFIISCYLLDDIKEFITDRGIKLLSSSNQSLLFDYFSFCRSINVNTINNIISIGSTIAYNQFFMQQEFYSLFMRKCPELKYFDMKSIKHQIFYFPGAMIRLESLCELTCETSTDASYFYGLSLYCQYIQKLIIFNTDPKSYYGIVRLIEVQKNLKHFEWVDDFNDGHFTSDDHYEKVFLTLEKKAESLNYLKVFFEYMLNRDYEILQDVLSKFSKLKVLIIDALLYFEDEQVDKLRMQVYNELELLSMNNNRIDIIYSIIENSGSRLKEVLFRPYDAIDCDYEGFDENSLIFIRKIYENCPLIEYLSITFPPLEEHFAEFEKLLKICQNLKSLLLLIFSDIETNEEYLKNGEILLKILTRSASSNLKEIRICNRIKFSLENLEEFFEKWKGKQALSILTVDPIYLEEDYTKLINKYKSNGIIKDFKYVNHTELDNSYTL